MQTHVTEIGRRLEDSESSDRTLSVRVIPLCDGRALGKDSSRDRGRDVRDRVHGCHPDAVEAVNVHTEQTVRPAVRDASPHHEVRRDREIPDDFSLDAEGRVTTHAYDLDGARSTTLEADGRAWQYVWDAQGRLIEAIDANGVSTRFEYDALGRRVAKHHGGRVTRWLWDEDVVVHEWVEEGGRSSPVSTWLFEPESHIPLARLQPSAEDAVVTDHLGTPVALLDSAGEISWSAELGIWGEARVHRGEPERCPLRWPGQYEDAETGLYYNRFRYYDPRAGQYLCPDPAGLGGGMASYAYVPDPVAQTDPLGLAANFENLYPEDVPGSRYGVVQLVQRDGVWYEMSGQYQGSRARGLYDFVVIDGEVHAVRMRGRNVVGHVSLANGASVQYAGMVRFGTGTTTRGIVTAWDNGSGHFMPHPGWAHQAPFPRELFSAVDFQPHRAPNSVHGPQLPIIGHGHSARCGL